MTREEARKEAEVMLAYAEGKNIQFSHWGIEDWQPCVNPTFQFSRYHYRVQSEQTYRPFKDMERAVGEVFDFDGIKLQVKDAGNKCCCDGCYFDEPEHLCFNVHSLYRAGYCYEPNRSDGKNVIFVEVKNNQNKEDKL